jgi:predicted membrane channel-forming protein YqfA (hemolysin III family)
MEAHLTEYRKSLVEAERRSQEAYDKAVLSLSGGGLAISFAFLKDYLAGQQPAMASLLFVAWVCWGFSASAILASFFASSLALRKAISQVDENSIYTFRAGGAASTVTAILNVAAGILFLLGVIAAAIFASLNMR